MCLWQDDSDGEEFDPGDDDDDDDEEDDEEDLENDVLEVGADDEGNNRKPSCC